MRWKKYVEIMLLRAWKRRYHTLAARRSAGEKLSREELELMGNAARLPGIKDLSQELLAPRETTYPKRHSKTFRELAELLQGKKKIIVNDIGYGEPGFRKSRTKQPWELINALENTGARVDYWGYDYYPFKARLTEEQKPEKYREKAKFAGMDIVTAVPSRKADVTVFLNVKHYLTRDEREVAIRHVVDSTKKGGYIVTDVEPDKIRDKRIKLEKVVEEEKSYRTKYIYKRIK